MGLGRPIVWLLVVVWLVAFGCFAVVGQLAFVSGNTFEYRLYGVPFPYVWFGLWACMSTSSGLLWANYKGQDFRGTEELVYGGFFGLSVFCLMIGVVLVL